MVLTMPSISAMWLLWSSSTIASAAILVTKTTTFYDPVILEINITKITTRTAKPPKVSRVRVLRPLWFAEMYKPCFSTFFCKDNQSGSQRGELMRERKERESERRKKYLQILSCWHHCLVLVHQVIKSTSVQRRWTHWPLRLFGKPILSHFDFTLWLIFCSCDNTAGGDLGLVIKNPGSVIKCAAI